jgi:hypothetical protein
MAQELKLEDVIISVTNYGPDGGFSILIKPTEGYQVVRADGVEFGKPTRYPVRIWVGPTDEARNDRQLIRENHALQDELRRLRADAEQWPGL